MAPRESVGTDGGWPADIPVALAFEVVRQTQDGGLAHPREWLEIIAGAASVADIVRESEAQLAGERPVDLADWVMKDLPSHEAHFIDARSDLIRAMVLMSVYATTPEGRPPRVSVGRTLRGYREQVLQAINELEHREAELVDKYEI